MKLLKLCMSKDTILYLGQGMSPRINKLLIRLPKDQVVVSLHFLWICLLGNQSNNLLKMFNLNSNLLIF